MKELAASDPGVAIEKIARAAAVLVLCASGLISHAAERVDFQREIFPILADNCFHCHGPDEEARKADLRLDVKESAFRVEEGIAIISPGHSEKSELVLRIASEDPEERMPPPKANRSLTDAQKNTLKRWIDEGAKWESHWAFTPRRPVIPPPNVQTNPIDAFVSDALAKQKMQPSKPASKSRLLRRVTLDLTGLPPTPDEMEAFLRDESPDAYKKVLDRLLQSPRYGERLASDWLDLARYADTHGYQMDRFRPMWPYRDWVIKAFNENLPYDRFVLWQLAGDLLPDASKEQRIATAFNRLHMQNEEGGVVEEEFRVNYVVDRVTTFGTAFLGLTLECARCHDHKFDPISQREFYSLFAFFQNIDESGQTSYFTDAMPVPTLLLTNGAHDQQFAELRRKMNECERDLAALRASADGAFASWLATERSKENQPAGCVAAFDFDALCANSFPNSIDSATAATLHENPKLVPGRRGQAIELDGENGLVFPALGHFNRTDSFSFALWIEPQIVAPRAVVLHHSKAPIDAGSRGYELLVEEGHVAFALHHMWPGNSLKVRTAVVVRTSEWTHVTVSYDGSSRAGGVQIYLDGRAAKLEVIRDQLRKDITYEGGEPDLAIGYRFRDNGFKAGRVDELRIYDRALTAFEVAQLVEPDRPPDASLDRAKLFDHFFETAYPPARTARARLKALRVEENKLVQSIAEIMVMDELPTPKVARILARGAYDAPRETVRAETPRVLPPFPATAPRNRLGLAEWLIDRDHPLFARVTVNRFWQMMFGQGLVETSDNFGAQGATPTHPKLLDWLANDFIASGWDVKALLRKIALSETYRQDSTAIPDLHTHDPENKLLARGPARRLTAEMLRDQALLLGGLLVDKLGGPSVNPYQPDALWDIAMGKPAYNQGKGPDLYRRSIYTFWKRTVPPPALMTFDAADRSYCTVRRQSTSTPLQALALLNDVQIVEAARHAAQRMIKEGGATLHAQIHWIFRTISGRDPSSREHPILMRLYQEQHAIFSRDPSAAGQLLAFGETKCASDIDPVALAAGTVLAHAIFNHDEALMRR